MRLFLPTARQICILLLVGALSLGCALYLRYRVIEQSSVGLACDAGLQSWLCLARTGATGLFRHSAFGIVALAAAVINVLRPSVVVLALGLAAGGFGIVLYNVGLSALAVALLMLSLARPAPGTA
jgi:hypothetical protein